MKKRLLALTGNDATAYAMKQIKPDVVAAYPITPQTSLMEKFAEYVADGDVDTEMILVESEHSAMSACVGSSAAGARTMTATSSCGLALMWEILYVAASSRLPIVMPVINRALSAPINIHCDHSDTMGARDSGWIQIFCENAQECYDSTIQAMRIAEHPEVRLPVMVNSDGFVISHGMETVAVYTEEDVKSFVGEFKPMVNLLDVKNPITIGPLDLQDYYFEHKRQQVEGMAHAAGVIKAVGEEFGKKFGTRYGLVEPYKLDGAELVIVGLGSTMGTLRLIIDEARTRGIKAGLLKVRAFRPFPQDEIRNSLKGMKAIAILDRSDSFNAVSGPLFGEVRSALYGVANAPLINYIYGLGGRDTSVVLLESIVSDLVKTLKAGRPEKDLIYLGVRE